MGATGHGQRFEGTEWWRLAFCRLIVFCFAKRTGVFGALFVFIILFTCYTEYVHIEMKEETNEHHNQRPNQPSHRIRMGRLPQNLPARQRRRRQEQQIRGYMLSKNGEAGYKVLPVSELQRVWDQSCPLRFINNWALDKNYVPQCYEKPVTIEAR